MKLSRRQLARYATQALVKGESPRTLAKRLAASLLVDNRRHDLELLLNDIDLELARTGELVTATVTTTRSLSQTLRQEIEQFVKHNLAVKQVVLKKRVDQSVLGGLKLVTPIRSWDSTLTRQLAEMERYN